MPTDNSEQIAEWNGALGQRWVAMQREIDRIVHHLRELANQQCRSQLRELRILPFQIRGDRLHEPPVKLGQHRCLVVDRHHDAERESSSHAKVQWRLSVKPAARMSAVAATCGSR